MRLWKNFENRLIFDEDMENDKARRFLGDSVESLGQPKVKISWS